MIIKNADDRLADIEYLRSILTMDNIAGDIKELVEREIKSIEIGAAGEKKASYHIDFHFAKNPKFAVIHDLRLEIDDRVAQIDHLIINTKGVMWCCETKNYNAGLSISDNGEFTAFYGGKPFAIPSPAEQNVRHITVLKDAVKKIGDNHSNILGMSIKPVFLSLIVVSPKSRISFAGRKLKDHAVIKADMINKKIAEDDDRCGFVNLLGRMSADDLQAYAEELAGLHRPFQMDYAKKFNLADYSSNAEIAKSDTKDDKPVEPADQRDTNPVERDDKDSHAETKSDRPSGYVDCDGCGGKIRKAEIIWCRTHKDLYGGMLFCKKCQAAHRK